MKVAFYCDYDRDITSKIKTLEEGNIGIGGTQFLFMLVVSNLQKKHENERNQYILLSNKEFNIEQGILKYEKVGSITDALEWCEKNQYDYIIIRANSINLLSNEMIKKSTTKIILWAHNYISKKIEEILYKEEKIKKLICVSEQQYLNMKGSNAFSKMDYVNNCIGNDTTDIEVGFAENLIYLGVPTPVTGVHNAIKIFRKVKKKNTNCKLMIIGSLKVRNTNMQLGKMKITYKEYENYLMKLIKKYRLEENVVFLGRLNSQQVKLLVKEGGIGIVNPSHFLIGETFCLSALELESYGIPIVSRKRKDGLSTSVKDKNTGYLEKKDRKIAKRIQQLLNNKEQYYNFSKNAKIFSKNFRANIQVDKWYTILNELEEKNNDTNKGKIRKKYYFLKIETMLKRIQNRVLLAIYKKWMR